MIYRQQVTLTAAMTTTEQALLTLATNKKARLVGLHISSIDTAAKIVKIGVVGSYLTFQVGIGANVILPYNPAGYMEWAVTAAILVSAVATLTADKTIEVNAVFEGN